MIWKDFASADKAFFSLLHSVSSHAAIDGRDLCNGFLVPASVFPKTVHHYSRNDNNNRHDQSQGRPEFILVHGKSGRDWDVRSAIRSHGVFEMETGGSMIKLEEILWSIATSSVCWIT